MKSYVINLDRRDDRLRKFQNLAEIADVKVERIKAIDGKIDLITDDHWLQKYNNTEKIRYMTKGEIACYLSHYKVWESSREDEITVFEDDARIPIMFNYDLNNYLKYLPKDYDMPLLGTNNTWFNKYKDNSKIIWENKYWFKYQGDVYGLQSYIIKRNAIDVLKDSKYPINCPIDIKINHIGLNVYILKENMVSQCRWGSDTQAG